MIPVVGVEELTISTSINEEGECAFDEGPLIGVTYIISSKKWEMYLHDTCFFHMVFTIRKYFDKNGVNIPEVLRGKKTTN